MAQHGVNPAPARYTVRGNAVWQRVQYPAQSLCGTLEGADGAPVLEHVHIVVTGQPDWQYVGQLIAIYPGDPAIVHQQFNGQPMYSAQAPPQAPFPAPPHAPFHAPPHVSFQAPPAVSSHAPFHVSSHLPFQPPIPAAVHAPSQANLAQTQAPVSVTQAPVQAAQIPLQAPSPAALQAVQPVQPVQPVPVPVQPVPAPVRAPVCAPVHAPAVHRTQSLRSSVAAADNVQDSLRVPPSAKTGVEYLFKISSQTGGIATPQSQTAVASRSSYAKELFGIPRLNRYEALTVEEPEDIQDEPPRALALRPTSPVSRKPSTSQKKPAASSKKSSQKEKDLSGLCEVDYMTSFIRKPSTVDKRAGNSVSREGGKSASQPSTFQPKDRNKPDTGKGKARVSDVATPFSSTRPSENTVKQDDWEAGVDDWGTPQKPEKVRESQAEDNGWASGPSVQPDNEWEALSTHQKWPITAILPSGSRPVEPTLTSAATAPPSTIAATVPQPSAVQAVDSAQLATPVSNPAQAGLASQTPAHDAAQTTAQAEAPIQTTHSPAQSQAPAEAPAQDRSQDQAQAPTQVSAQVSAPSPTPTHTAQTPPRTAQHPAQTSAQAQTQPSAPDQAQTGQTGQTGDTPPHTPTRTPAQDQAQAQTHTEGEMTATPIQTPTPSKTRSSGWITTAPVNVSPPSNHEAKLPSDVITSTPVSTGASHSAKRSPTSSPTPSVTPGANVSKLVSEIEARGAQSEESIAADRDLALKMQMNFDRRQAVENYDLALARHLQDEPTRSNVSNAQPAQSTSSQSTSLKSDSSFFSTEKRGITSRSKVVVDSSTHRPPAMTAGDRSQLHNVPGPVGRSRAANRNLQNGTFLRDVGGTASFEIASHPSGRVQPTLTRPPPVGNLFVVQQPAETRGSRKRQPYAKDLEAGDTSGEDDGAGSQGSSNHTQRE